MSKDGAVQQFTIELYHQAKIDPRRLEVAAMNGSLSRLLHHACHSEISHDERYDPECDHRVRWCREMIYSARSGRPAADADLTAIVEMLLDIAQEPAQSRFPAEL